MLKGIFCVGKKHLSKYLLNTLKEKRKISILAIDQIQVFRVAQPLPLLFHLGRDGSHSLVEQQAAFTSLSIFNCSSSGCLGFFVR